MDQQFAFREGMTVYGADGDKVGKVVAVDPNYIVVEKGFFFPTDFYIPTSAIASVDDDNIYLTVSKEEALNQGWDQPLTATTTDAYGEQPFDHDSHPDHTHVHEGNRVRVPVHEEELTATKRPVEAGTVRIEKDVVTEERTMDVPVTEERVTVRRVAADRAATSADATAFEEGVIEVPLRREQVDVEKRTRVAGEIEIEKEAVQRTEQVSGTVRREQVRVDDQTVEGAEFVDDRTNETGGALPR